MSRRSVLVLLLLAGVFAGLRGIAALAAGPDPTEIFTDRVVVVGVTDRAQLTETDRRVLASRLAEVQAGSMSIRARYVGDCAAAGWTTLGAGRRTAVGGLCAPQIADGRVMDWPVRVAAAAANRGDARLGTLADSVDDCVAAVGPGAALAAARPDGSLADFQSAADFVANGFRAGCPIVLVDPGGSADAIITGLALEGETTLIVTGIGPPPGSEDPSLQAVYRLGTTLPGWLTSASTRREGMVTLTDLTRTLIVVRVGRVGAIGAGGRVAVRGGPGGPDGAGDRGRLAATAALSDAIPRIYLAMGLVGGVPVVAAIVGLVRGRRGPLRLLCAAVTVLPTAMLLAGTVPWSASDRPVLLAMGVLLAWWAGLTALAWWLGSRSGTPVVVVAAGLAVAAFTIDAALGGPMQPGSLLNSRPIFGLRWYGFGNNTFAAYAVLGAAARRLARLAAARERAGRGWPLAAVALIGFGGGGLRGLAERWAATSAG